MAHTELPSKIRHEMLHERCIRVHGTTLQLNPGPASRCPEYEYARDSLVGWRRGDGPTRAGWSTIEAAVLQEPVDWSLGLCRTCDSKVKSSYLYLYEERS